MGEIIIIRKKKKENTDELIYIFKSSLNVIMMYKKIVAEIQVNTIIVQILIRFSQEGRNF